MTDEQRKLLTEFLGERWHDFELHTLDVEALKDKLVEAEMWDDFCEWTAFEENYGAESLADEFPSWSAWLFTMPRFAGLVAEFLERRRE